MVNIAYHCSADGNIKELTPKTSSHGTPYVYATPSKIISLVFGMEKHCDYIVHPVIDKEGKCTIIEMAPEALARYYRNKSAYIYQVNGDEFDVRTQWRGEICSTHAVKPLSVEYIPNLEAAILQEQKKGNIEIISYAERNNHGVNMDKEFAGRELAKVIRCKDYDYIKRRINYLKNLDNKGIFYHFQESLNRYLDGLKNKNSAPKADEQTIIPQKFLDKYKKDDSEETAFEVLANLSYCNATCVSQAIDEVRATDNKKLLQKIVFHLTKISNIVKETNSLQKKTPFRAQRD